MVVDEEELVQTTVSGLLGYDIFPRFYSVRSSALFPRLGIRSRAFPPRRGLDVHSASHWELQVSTEGFKKDN